MAKLEITNMVMVQNPITLEVVIQQRVKSWKGFSFPGGHAEDNETIYDSAVREIKEETGLDIFDLQPCGFMYWFNNQTNDRYFTYFYKTNKYTGQLLKQTDEGKVFWTKLDELDSKYFAPNFKEYLPMFLTNNYKEAYCSWNDDMNPDLTVENPWNIIYK